MAAEIIASVQMLDTEGLVITRKRKKWKFAHFNAWSNCFELQKNTDPLIIRRQLKAFFTPLQGATLQQRRLILELAAGGAEFSLQLARQNPKHNFIAVDVKSDRLYSGAKTALETGITNIAFLRTHMNELAGIFAEYSVDEIWLTFPDPFARKRSAKHRLTHPHFLALYKQALKKPGLLKFKTDNRELFLWSLEQFVAEKWQLKELSFDLHESDLPDEYKTKTYYEQRYTKEGALINFASLTK